MPLSAMREALEAIDKFYRYPVATDLWFVDKHIEYERFVGLCEPRQHAYPPYTFFGVRVHQIFLELLTDEDHSRLPWYCKQQGIWIVFSNGLVVKY